MRKFLPLRVLAEQYRVDVLSLPHRNKPIPLRTKRIFLILIVLLAYLSGQVQAEQVVPLHRQSSSFIGSTKASILALVTSQTSSIPQISFISVQEKKATRTPTPTPTTPPKKAESAPAKQSDNKASDTSTQAVASVSVGGSAQDILTALNAYRQKHGKSVLSWDGKLAGYAQERADLFARINDLDSHAGFRDFINNQDGFVKLGFYQLGENSGYGHKIEGTYLIEEVYAKSSAHNDNQLSGNWSHVGIGVSGSATNFVFGGHKR